MLHSLLLTLHILATIVWIGFGFYELWLGRLFHERWDTVLGAPLIRFIYRSDLAALLATMVVLASGLLLAITAEVSPFGELWVVIKLAIMAVVLGVVSFTWLPALKLGRMISGLRAGPADVTQEIHDHYLGLERWNLIMRALAVLAVLVAIWKPA